MNRRQMLKLTSAGAITALGAAAAEEAKTRVVGTVHAPVHRWEVFELILAGPSAGNPFVEVQWTATFALGHRTVVVDGFYDGAGKYKLRFMPDTEGEWSYSTTSNVSDLSGKTGNFICITALSLRARIGGRAQHPSFRVCRRHTLLSLWNHLLCMDASERRIAATNATDTARWAVQQDSHVRLPQELPIQPQRAAVLSL